MKYDFLNIESISIVAMEAFNKSAHVNTDNITASDNSLL